MLMSKSIFGKLNNINKFTVKRKTILRMFKLLDCCLDKQVKV